ncbi:MAG TPA: hypothetical protein VIL95_08965, partial [Bacillota bacterium]
MASSLSSLSAASAVGAAWRRAVTWVFGLATLGELVLILLPSSALKAALGAVFAIGLILAVPATDRLTRITIVPLLVAGGWLLSVSSASPVQWLEALAELGPIYAMTIAVRLVGIPIEYGDYAARLRAVLERWGQGVRGGHYLAWSALNYVLALLALFGSLPITYNLMDHTLERGPDPIRMMARWRLINIALLRSIALAATWGPVSAGATLSLHIAGVAWQAIVPIGILLSAVGMALSLLLERSWLSAWDDLAAGLESGPANGTGGAAIANAARGGTPKDTAAQAASAATMLAFFALLVAIVVACQQVFGWSIFASVTLASLVTSTVWVIRLGQARHYPRLIEAYVVRSLPQSASTFALFTALGVFIYALETSHAGETLAASLSARGLLGESEIATFALTEGLVLLLSFVGIPGLVALGVVGQPLVLTGALEPLPLALALIIGNVMAGASSPFSVSNLLLAALQPGTSPVVTGIRLNLVWA